jgi:hypothetical protein
MNTMKDPAVQEMLSTDEVLEILLNLAYQRQLPELAWRNLVNSKHIEVHATLTEHTEQIAAVLMLAGDADPRFELQP